MTQKTTSLALSKRMNKLGAKQVSDFYWYRCDWNEKGFRGKKFELIGNGEISVKNKSVPWSDLGNVELCSAFDTSELGEMLKDHIGYIRPCNAGYEVNRYTGDRLTDTEFVTGKTMAEALGEMWCYLKENKLI